MEIGIVNVVALNVLENFAIGGESAKGLVVRRAPENITGADVNQDDQGDGYDDLFLPKDS